MSPKQRTGVFDYTEYDAERANRKVFRHSELHISAIELILSLMLSANGTLEELYAEVEPQFCRSLNIPYYLHLHLNHPKNVDVLPELCERVQKRGPNSVRLLKLLCVRLFDASLYTRGDRIGAGSYGEVFKATIPFKPRDVAVKLTSIPKRIFDRCVLVDLFTEVTILEKFKTDRRVCHLYPQCILYIVLNC